MTVARTHPIGTLAAPVWTVADRQTEGRGRRGRDWSSPAGNLNATAAFAAGAPTRALPALCLVAGIALFDAVADLAPDKAGSLELKWPNDLMLDGLKLAGVLAETDVTATPATYIGFGANLVAVQRPDRETAALTGVTAAALLDGLNRTLSAHLMAWGASGFAAPVDAWFERGPALGTPVVRGAGTRLGLYSGLDEAGNLLARTADGVRRIDIDELT